MTTRSTRRTLRGHLGNGALGGLSNTPRALGHSEGTLIKCARNFMSSDNRITFVNKFLNIWLKIHCFIVIDLEILLIYFVL